MTGVAVSPAEGLFPVVVGVNPTGFLVQVGASNSQATNIPEGSDILMCQTPDDGEIEIVLGIVTRTSTPETAVYLSLFGGDDFWGNLDETESDKQYTAETGRLLDEIPPSPNNLKRIQSAVVRDLAWLEAVTDVEVFIPRLGHVTIVVNLSPGDSITFAENWSAIK